jgi:starch synthase (maltosyl-transferring)
LRDGPRSAFLLRFVLAATMAPNYGLYSGYELCENEPASTTNEEYLNSEKYEIKSRDWDDPRSLAPFITRVNDIRRRHPALAQLRTIHVHGVDDEHLIAYSKASPSGDDVVLVIVNLDPQAWHEGTTALDMGVLGLPWDAPFDVTDELTGDTFTWRGAHNYVRLTPDLPAHILHVHRPEL